MFVIAATYTSPRLNLIAIGLAQRAVAADLAHTRRLNHDPMTVKLTQADGRWSR